MSIEPIEVLEEEEKRFRGKSHLHELENRWRKVMSEVAAQDEERYLVHHNRFRLRNITSIEEKRPGLLLGYINDNHFPNFHTVEMLRVADIVSLTVKEELTDTIDRLHYNLAKDDMNSIRKRLPKGFQPTLYWDIQAAHGHIHPLGLSCAPFPSVASICHVQHGPAVKTISEMFDFVLPVGNVFGDAFSYGKASVLRFPFGINWASFHRFFEGGDEVRDIDVSVTFSTTSNPVYHGLRHQVTALVAELKRKWEGRFRIEIESGLPKDDYARLLLRSKISLNVVGINGPFNYRSCEIVNSGALLFQANVMEDGLEVDYEGILEEGTHFVSFNPENLETTLLEYLENEERLKEMAFSASTHLKDKYSYGKLSTSLMNKILGLGFQRDFSSSDKEKDKFLLGSLLWQQHQKEDIRLLGAAFIGQTLPLCSDDVKFYSNSLAVLPELIPSLGFDFLKDSITARNPSLAETLDPNNLKQIAVQLFTFKVDHVATCYNFLSLSLELQWSPPEVLRPIAEQAFVNKEWPGFSSEWLLRPCGKIHDMDLGEFQDLRYQRFYLPLLKASSKEQEWIAYRDYLLALLRIEVS
jgi:hypothetical protein